MSDTTTIALVALVFLALLMAVAAIGWLETVSNRLSALSKRVLESKDIDKIIEAADKMASIKSGFAEFENRINQSQNQLQEHETNLSKLATNLGVVEQMMEQHTADSVNASDKMLSLESRITGCEDRAEQRQNQLLESERKADERATRLESAEQVINKQVEDLVQANQSIKAVEDKIQNLEEFQAATEKFSNLLFAALSNMEGTRSKESLETGPKSRRLNEPLSIKELNQVSALVKRVTGRA